MIEMNQMVGAAASITQAEMDAAAKTLARLAVRNQASATDLALTLGAIGYLPAGNALKAAGSLANPVSRHPPQETGSDSRASRPDDQTAQPDWWCRCPGTRHDLNDPKAAYIRTDGRRECRVALNKRRRAKRAHAAAPKATS